MRNVRWLVAFALPFFIAPVFGQDNTSKAEKMEWRFEAGKAFYQKMETVTEQTMLVMGSSIKQKQTQTFYFKWEPKEKKGEDWLVKQKIDAVVMEIEIGGQQLQNPGGLSAKEVIEQFAALSSRGGQ